MEKETKCKYIDGKVYKLVHSNSDLIYIGSTTKLLCNRLSSHKAPSNKAQSKKLFAIDGIVNIELIEAYPCTSKEELKERERYHIELNKDKVVNKNIPNRTIKESNKAFYQKDIENNRKKRTEYYEKHKEEMIKQHKQYNEANKEKQKEYFKQRYENNKEQRKVDDAKRRSTEGYKQYQKEYNKNYRIKNKEKLQLLNKQKWQKQKRS